MSRTRQISVDNLSPHAIAASGPCRKITIREIATDTSPQKYDVMAPYSTSPAFRKFEGEPTEFTPGARENMFQTSEVVGYVQTVASTITLSVIEE